jgi:hypothetical protein
LLGVTRVYENDRGIDASEAREFRMCRNCRRNYSGARREPVSQRQAECLVVACGCHYAGCRQQVREGLVGDTTGETNAWAQIIGLRSALEPSAVGAVADYDEDSRRLEPLERVYYKVHVLISLEAPDGEYYRLPLSKRIVAKYAPSRHNSIRYRNRLAADAREIFNH